MIKRKSARETERKKRKTGIYGDINQVIIKENTKPKIECKITV